MYSNDTNKIVNTSTQFCLFFPSSPFQLLVETGIIFICVLIPHDKVARDFNPHKTD